MTPLLLALALQCPDGSPPPCGRPATRTGAPAPSSVAVLFLESRDTAVAYLADGLTEDIATSLGRVSRLQVKAPSSVRRAQRVARGDLRSLGRSLNVHYVVDGSLRRIGERYRVAIRLVAAQSEVTAWGNTFDRTADQLLQLPGEVATAVAGIMGGSLAANEEAAVSTRPTTVSAAWDRYLRGNFYFARRTGPWAARAVAEYEAATQLDPSFALAFARMSYAYGTVLYWGWPFRNLPPDSLLARTRAAAGRALELAPNSADALMAHAEGLRVSDPRRYSGVIETLRRAVAIDPRNADAWHALGSFLRDLGQDSAAEAAHRRSLEIEPDRPVTLHGMSILAGLAGRDDESRGWTDSALAVNPDFEISLWSRAVTRAQDGNIEGSRRDLARLEQLAPPDHYLASAQAYVAARAGDSAAARRHVARATAAFPPSAVPSPVDAVIVLTAHVGLGDRESALSFLERARPRGTALWSLLRMTFYDPLRGEPRFQAVMAESRP